MAEAEMTVEVTAYKSDAETGADWRSGIEDAQVRRFAERFPSPADAAPAAQPEVTQAAQEKSSREEG
jgi:hypothetical protein